MLFRANSIRFYFVLLVNDSLFINVYLYMLIVPQLASFTALSA